MTFHSPGTPVAPLGVRRFRTHLPMFARFIDRVRADRSSSIFWSGSWPTLAAPAGRLSSGRCGRRPRPISPQPVPSSPGFQLFQGRHDVWCRCRPAAGSAAARTPRWIDWHGAACSITMDLVNDPRRCLKRIPVRPRVDLPLRGPGHHVRPVQRSVLPLPHSRATPGRAGPLVRRGRRARRASGHRRLRSGDREHQGPPRAGRPARRPLAGLRRAGAVVPRPSKVRRDPACPACGPDAGEIVIAEYDDLCMPHTH